VEPTHTDVRYSEAHTRSVLDVWLPRDTDAKTPLVVYFHGGGFHTGDKKAFYNHALLKEFHDKGIAFASVNDPLLDELTHLQILVHAGGAMAFLKSKSEEWNLDTTRIAVGGTSAGAMIAEYLTYWQDHGIKACFAEEQPYRSWFLLPQIQKGKPPLILYTQSGPTDEVHSPAHAKQFKARCDAVGVTSEIYGSAASGLPRLPDGVTMPAAVMAFFVNHWTPPDATEAVENEP
jgi:predicted esterase